MSVKVSVILPVYNASDYLHQCMDSIVGQTLKDIEIICVDDGSTDNSLDILKEYEQKDKRVKVIQQKNAGAGAARNNGLSIATGEYLSFLDSDDFFEPDMLEKAYEKAKEENFLGTDDSSLVEKYGGKVKISLGDYGNIKITTIEDINFLKREGD